MQSSFKASGKGLRSFKGKNPKKQPACDLFPRDSCYSILTREEEERKEKTETKTRKKVEGMISYCFPAA